VWRASVTTDGWISGDDRVAEVAPVTGKAPRAATRIAASFPEGFASVVFDCDSTLSAIEGIDVLAGPHATEISALTDAAMDGSVPLEEVYGRRLAVIRPNRERVEALAGEYLSHLVEDVRETTAALLWLGKDVRIISGGLLQPVATLASALGIPGSGVAAVRIDFAPDGSYAGFDTASPLARSGGKAAVVRSWDLARPSMLVGDGATDLEARPELDLFAAYMGVAFRPAVAEHADVVLRARSLAPVLALAAGAADRARLASSLWAGLLARGDVLLGSDHESTTPAR
jgi:phosphoserine phosphatase